MKRREFIAVLSAVATWPRAAWAQQSANIKRIAVVTPVGPVANMNENSEMPFYRAFFSELRQLGYIEGNNLLVERRSGEGKTERYGLVARELVDLKPDVMVITSGRILAYFREATTTIPIVALTGDPILFGIVSNLARPEGNITGFSGDASIEIHGKYLEILRDLKPSLSRVGLVAPRLAWEPYGRPLREIASRMNLTIVGPAVDSPFGESEYRNVIEAMVRDGAEGLLVTAAAENYPNRGVIIESAKNHRLVAIYPFAAYAKQGGLVAYAVDLADIGIRAGGYVHKLLQGAKPGELPYYMPTKLQLIINLKSAKELDLFISPTLLTRADEVIE